MDARETDAGETGAIAAGATRGLQRPTSGQRLAAAVALPALAGAVVVVALSLLGNPGRRGIEPVVLRPGDDLRALVEQAG